MPTLKIEGNSTVDIRPGSTTLGRSPDNTIVFSQSSVSKRHALITYQLNPDGTPRLQIADLHSTNGTFVNGKRITYHTLKNNDVVTLGSVTCQYSED